MTKRMRFKARRTRKGDFMPDDTSKIMRQVVLDPIAAAEAASEKYVQGEDNWRHEKYHVLATVYALGQFMKYNGTAFRRFIESSFFDFRKRPLRPIKDQPKAMRIAAYAVLNADNPAKRDRAATYVRGLQVLARRNVRADDVVAEIIKAGGIEALAAAAKTDPTRPQRYEAPEKDQAAQRKYYDVSEEGEMEQEEQVVDLGAASDERSRYAPEPRGMSTSVRERGYDPKGRPTVEFETETDERQEWFLDLRKKRSAWVLVESLGRSKDGWRRLRIREVIPQTDG